MTTELAQDMKTTKNDAQPSTWSAILASIAFSCAAYAMLQLYSLVHWKIMLDNGRPRDREILEPVYIVLQELSLLRLVFAVLSIIWAVWSFKGRPRWASMIALAFAIFAVMINLIIM